MELTLSLPASTVAKPIRDSGQQTRRAHTQPVKFGVRKCPQTIGPGESVIGKLKPATIPPPPKDDDSVKAMLSDWTTYRTRFLVRARQLDQPLTFVDCLGREHSGQTGDYLILSSDGSRRIAPREIFEDIYVPMNEPLTPQPADDHLAASSPECRTTAISGVPRDSDQRTPRLDPRSPLSPTLRSHQDARRRASGRPIIA
jgi:hypothetical protein